MTEHINTDIILVSLERKGDAMKIQKLTEAEKKFFAEMTSPAMPIDAINADEYAITDPEIAIIAESIINAGIGISI